MKLNLITLILSVSLLTLNAQEKKSTIDSVKVIEDFTNFYQYQNFYLAGQPSLEALSWLKKQGVTKIINLRSEGENEEFTKYAYKEDEQTKKLGFEYFSIPVKGKAGYTPENLAKMDSIISGGEKVLIHCAGAGRVRHFFMAYLVKTKNYTIDEAVSVGKQMKFYLPIELLLSEELSISFKE